MSLEFALSVADYPIAISPILKHYPSEFDRFLTMEIAVPPNAERLHQWAYHCEMTPEPLAKFPVVVMARVLLEDGLDFPLSDF